MATTTESTDCVTFQVDGTSYGVEAGVLSKYPNSQLARIHSNASGGACHELKVDFPEKQFKRIIEYMRQESLDLKDLTSEEVMELSKISTQYTLPNLQSLCAEHLKRRDTLREKVNYQFDKWEDAVEFGCHQPPNYFIVADVRLLVNFNDTRQYFSLKQFFHPLDVYFSVSAQYQLIALYDKKKSSLLNRILSCSTDAAQQALENMKKLMEFQYKLKINFINKKLL